MEKRKLFISYSWKDKEQVDEIDYILNKHNILVTRDIRDLKFSDSNIDYMNKIRTSDFILLVISDSFLKSSYCMYEVSQLIKDERYLERILPVIVSDVDIFTVEGRWTYVKYWKYQTENLKQKLSLMTSMAYASPLIDEINNYSNINFTINEFLNTLNNINLIRFESLSENICQIVDQIERVIKTQGKREKIEIEVSHEKVDIDKKPYKAFISYAHDDKAYFDILLPGIKKHSKNYDWKIWEDSQIPFGKFWHEEIVKQIHDCDFAILLVSSSFLYSEYISKVEFNLFLKKKDREKFLFFPVLLEPCKIDNWEELSKRQFFVPNGADYGMPKIKELTYADLVRFDRDNCLIKDPMRERYHMNLIGAIEKSMDKLDKM